MSESDIIKVIVVKMIAVKVIVVFQGLGLILDVKCSGYPEPKNTEHKNTDF